MPMPIWLAHRMAARLTEVRKEGIVDFLRPDGKTQVSIEYEDGVPTRLDTVLISTQHDPGVNIERRAAARADRARHQAVAAGAVRRRRLRDLRQPDRQLRARRPARRLRPHRPQDHRRHLRRHGPARRRRVLGQGPDQGRPLGRVRGAPDREGGRGRGTGQAVRSAGRVRDRRRAPGVDHGRHVRHVGRSPTRSSKTRCARCSTCAPPRSSSGSTCAARSSGAPPRTATSAAPTATASRGRTSTAVRRRTPPGGRRIAHAATRPRVCRVVPDVTARRTRLRLPRSRRVGRRSVRVGTIVRVPLHGRRVRGLGRGRRRRARRPTKLLPIAAVVVRRPAARRRRA